MPILPMALSLVMGYAIHTQFSRICFSVLQSPSASVYGCVLVATSADAKLLEDHEPEERIHGWMTLTKILVPTCFNCLNCTKFGQLILRKIIKIDATRCPILRLKCTKFDFGWGSATNPAGGAYSAPPDPLAGFKGPTSKGRGWKGREGKGRGGKGWEGGREEGEGKGWGAI